MEGQEREAQHNPSNLASALKSECAESKGFGGAQDWACLSVLPIPNCTAWGKLVDFPRSPSLCLIRRKSYLTATTPVKIGDRLGSIWHYAHTEQRWIDTGIVINSLSGTSAGVLVHLCVYSEIPETGGLKQQTFLSYNSGGWKPKIKVPADSVPVPGWQMAVFSLRPHMAERERESSLVLFS